MKRRILLLLWMGISHLLLFGQYKKEFPEIGKPFPSFVLRDVVNYPKKQLSVSDLKGQYVILDFFNEGCSACVASWPHSKKIQEKFAGKLTMFLVGVKNTRSGKSDLTGVKRMYDLYRKKLDLKFPAAFDTTTGRRFDINAGPLLIWLDRDGVIKAITLSSDLTEKNVEAFINDKEFDYADRSNASARTREAFDMLKPMLINGNGGNDTDFIYRSVFTKFDVTKMNYGSSSLQFWAGRMARLGLCQLQGLTLSSMYQTAYFGQNYIVPKLNDEDEQNPLYGNVWNHPVLEIKDSTLFYKDMQGKNEREYCYSLKYNNPQPTEDYLMFCLRNDMANNFPYEATVETRNMPYYKLVVADSTGKNLIFKGSKYSMTGDPNGAFTVTGEQITHIIWKIYTIGDRPPILNETGIKEKVNLSMDCVWTDIDDIRRSLRNNGLDLIKSEKPMKVLVIRDRKPISGLYQKWKG